MLKSRKRIGLATVNREIKYVSRNSHANRESLREQCIIIIQIIRNKQLLLRASCCEYDQSLHK